MYKLCKKFAALAFALTGTLSTAAPVVVATASQTEISKLNVAGTPPRKELEYKISLGGHNLEKSKVIKDVGRAVSDLLTGDTLQFPKLVGRSYKYKRKSKSFAFRDHYFDDDKMTLSQNDITYRLRYRWKRYADFKQHIAFPFLKSFFPHRCEIQLKSNYQQTPTGMTEAEETRFEFRNASAPFDAKKDAPKAPWPLKEFEQYAKYGKFRDYTIYPYYQLEKELTKAKKFRGELQQSVVLLTERTRSHIRIKSPWGTGPNPDQTFIITLDHVRPLAIGSPITQNHSKKNRD